MNRLNRWMGRVNWRAVGTYTPFGLFIAYGVIAYGVLSGIQAISTLEGHSLWAVVAAVGVSFIAGGAYRIYNLTVEERNRHTAHVRHLEQEYARSSQIVLQDALASQRRLGEAATPEEVESMLRDAVADVAARRPPGQYIFTASSVTTQSNGPGEEGPKANEEEPPPPDVVLPEKRKIKLRGRDS